MTSGMEAAVEDDDVLLTTLIPDADPAGLARVERLLSAFGLGLDPDVELVVTGHDSDGRLLGCLGLAGSVVKGAACVADAQGTGLMARLMERLNNEALDRGRAHLFLFTTPRNREIFEGLGFTTLAEVPDSAVLLENTPFGLSRYVAELAARRRPGSRIGAVVLNANPFTLGHRYLVERAASETDCLHVFVVGEDASEFGPAVRLRLVCEGIAELDLGDGVVVHPGSRYIVSRATFPHYFLHREASRAKAAAGLDLQLFRTAIAPALGITDRYVGTEPHSAVTASYNTEMRHWLQSAPSAAPAIRVHEIPRLELDGAPVSASAVRAAPAAGERDALARLVPAPTLAYLTAHNTVKEH